MTAHTTLLYLIVTAALIGGLAQAEDVDIVSGASIDQHTDSMRQRYGDDGNPFEHFGDELGLTGQQRTDIQIIIADYMPRYRDLARIGRESATSLLSLAPDSAEYLDATQKASATAASSAAELVVLLSEMRAKLYAVLSPEQRQTLQERIESHRDAGPEDSPAP